MRRALHYIALARVSMRRADFCHKRNILLVRLCET
jgi:hypothetical protein